MIDVIRNELGVSVRKPHTVHGDLAKSDLNWRILVRQYIWSVGPDWDICPVTQIVFGAVMMYDDIDTISDHCGRLELSISLRGRCHWP